MSREFIVVDHELLLITNANFSYAAENRNVEFGILVRGTALATSVEGTITSKHGCRSTSWPDRLVRLL